MSAIFLLFAHLRKGDHTHLVKVLCLLHVFVIYDLEKCSEIFWVLSFFCNLHVQSFFYSTLPFFYNYLFHLEGLGFFCAPGYLALLRFFLQILLFRYLFANSSCFILIFLLRVLNFYCVSHFFGCVLGQVYFPFIFTCCF